MSRKLEMTALAAIVAVVVVGVALTRGPGGTKARPEPAVTAAPSLVEPAPPQEERGHPAGSIYPDRGSIYPDRPPDLAPLAKVIADPANSDVPPQVFAELSALGAAVLRADVTGEGRDRWPDYWPATAVPCCRNLLVHAAGAYLAGGPARVGVRVLWSADEIGGTRISYRESQVPLRLVEGTWRPQ